MNKLDQRLCALEVKVEDMENGQRVIEESLAYINKYVVQQK